MFCVLQQRRRNYAQLFLPFHFREVFYWNDPSRLIDRRDQICQGERLFHHCQMLVMGFDLNAGGASYGE